MTPQSFGVLFTAGTFVFCLLAYLLYMQWRRSRYKDLANALGARYQPQHFYDTGEIIGSSEGHKYKIETKDHGRSGMWTVTTLDCVNRGLPLSVYGGFFKCFPDWRFVSTIRNEGACSGWQLTAQMPALHWMKHGSLRCNVCFRKWHLKEPTS